MIHHLASPAFWIALGESSWSTSFCPAQRGRDRTGRSLAAAAGKQAIIWGRRGHHHPGGADHHRGEISSCPT
jgi:hypothetical protein